MGTLRILVVDDHEIVRKGLRAVLEKQPGWQVVAEAANGREAIEKAIETKPDITILDISMPSLNGLEAVRQIVKKVRRTKILVLTVHDSDVMINQVLEAGARGFLLKTDAGRDLVTAVEALRQDKTYFTQKADQLILNRYLDVGNPPAAEGEDPAQVLTARQREIVQLLAEGKSSKEVAVALGLSVKTAETHRANIMRRINCHSVTELVHYAVRNHIIEA
jgi:DNA-binding NarL/FixJ family response regulator